MIQLMTETEKKRAQRDNEIVACFRDLKKKNPKAADTRIITAMAQNNIGGLTSICGVRNVLIRRGIIG